MKQHYRNLKPVRGILILILSGVIFGALNGHPLYGQADSLSRQEVRSHYSYMATMSLGMLPGSHDVIGWVPVSMQFSQGFLHVSGFYTGITFGVETFEPDILPVVFDLRYYMPKKRAFPFLGTGIGYGITLTDEYYGSKYPGGLYFGAGAGVNFKINETNSWWFYVGYRYQEIRGTTEDYAGHSMVDLYTYNRMELRMGISFK